MKCERLHLSYDGGWFEAIASARIADADLENNNKWPLTFAMQYELSESEFKYLLWKIKRVGDDMNILAWREDGIS